MQKNTATILVIQDKNNKELFLIDLIMEIPIIGTIYKRLEQPPMTISMAAFTAQAISKSFYLPCEVSIGVESKKIADFAEPTTSKNNYVNNYSMPF